MHKLNKFLYTMLGYNLYAKALLINELNILSINEWNLLLINELHTIN